MSQLLRDLHVSGLQYVGESVSNPPVNVNKYKRYSIPYNPNRHCLGYIEGPAASFSKDTRNDRGYVLKLWKNIENSDDFKEGMQHATIIGELDHPEERIDYSLANGAVVLTDWEIREDQDILWCRFAILDNQRGKDLLAYVKFGTILGVSSRGLGDEIIQDGRNIIDPDTYEFYCFDVVAFPAAEVARQQFVPVEALTEAKSVREAFSDKVVLEAAKCTTREQLIELKNVVESTSVSDKARLVEAITDKLSSLPESTGDERTTGDEEEKEDEKRILLSSHVEAMREKDSQIESLKQKLKQRGENSQYFRRVVQEQRRKIEELEDATGCGLDSIDELSAEYEVLESHNAELEAQIRSVKSMSDTRIQQLEAKLSKSRERCRSAIVESQRLQDQVAALSTKLTESHNHMRCIESELRTKLESANEYIEQLRASSNVAIREKQQLAEQSKQAFKESESLVAKKNLKIKSLQSQLSEATESVHNSEQRCQITENALKETRNKLQKTESYAEKVADAYIQKVSAAHGIKAEAVKSMLPNNFSIDDVDKVVESLSERQRRFDSLPLSMKPISARVVEQKSSGNVSNSNSFVVKALSQGSQ